MRDAKNALGVILIHQKRYEEAVAVLEPLANDIIYTSPDKSWGNLGWAYLEAGKPDQAIAALERAVAAQPNFCVGHYRLGLAFQRKGQHAAARDAFGRALAITVGECAKLQDAFAARARSLRALGSLPEAQADLERCRDLAPTTPVGKQCASDLARDR
jgi:Tfp pilus assembly protein PilF